MAVVSLKSTLYRAEQTGGAVPDALMIRGVTRRATGSVSNAATDSNLSMYKLITLPSFVILHPETIFDVENWGFAAVRIGTKATVGALLSVATNAATTQSPITARAAAAGNRLWQTLGLSADPKTDIDLYAHAIAGATGAGVMPFCIAWVDNT
jgi:hypothetical protein